ncbi:MAG: hypothetical protein HY459_00480 [Parcubacteria group bacterium]|nr:hypothetical protein [Parcubacteria group bacterium]
MPEETLISSKLARKPSTLSTQAYLDIAEIRDSTVVLKNGAMRAVLMVSSVNFALKSPEEQNAIIYAYQNFINSLNFPVQVVIHSRHLDITKYLEQLKQREKEQLNELLRIQTAEYHEFVKSLVELSDIMTKSFYAVVPYFPPDIIQEGLVSRLRNAIFPAQKETFSHSAANFERHKVQLWRRVDYITSGLLELGLKVVALNTEELIELYYISYNPDTAATIRLGRINEISFDSGYGSGRMESKALTEHEDPGEISRRLVT